MKKIILLLVLLVGLQMNSQTLRSSQGYLKSISFGVDPIPLLGQSNVNGLDMNLKLIFGNENHEHGLSAEYFPNINYLSYGVFYDFIVIGKGTSFDTEFQGLIGVETQLISRFSNDSKGIPLGYFGLSGGVNATARWNITEYIGIEGIINCKYRGDKKALWGDEGFNELFPISGRLNLIFILS